MATHTIHVTAVLTEEASKAYNEIMATPKNPLQTSYVRRGVVIHETTRVEGLMDEVITCYFITNKKKRDNFMHAVLARESFSLFAKTALVKYLFKQVDKKGYEEAIKRKVGFNKALDTILEYRNDIAHRGFVLLDESVPGDRSRIKKLITTDAGPETNPVELTHLRVMKHYHDCQWIIGLLTKLKEDIAKKKP